MHRFYRWRDAIQAANNPEAVLVVVHDYLTVIPHEVADLLPPECQRALKDSDLQRAAITILHCELAYKGDPFVAEALHEIAHTYAAASMRIARLTKAELSGGE